jgi:dihydrofolate synthase/folylpolyglutamate synthase
MNYKTSLNRLYRLSWRGASLGLDRVREAAALLGDPQKGLTCIQVAGTNGKGSVAHIISQAAYRAGLKVGLYTSPHMHRFSERFRVDGKEVEIDTLDLHLTKVLDLLDASPELQLTFFEVATLTAFCVFQEERVDLAVLEVGLGGRLDATSIAEPQITVVMSIGFDHTELLGNTLAAIAREKAAIARRGVPMVAGNLKFEALASVEKTASEKGALLHVLGRDFFIPSDMDVPWPGDHNRGNAAVALRVFEILGEKDGRLDRSVFIDSLKTTSLPPGRFETVKGEPSFIFDIAHNLEAAEALVDSLELSHMEPDVLIFGALKDKPAKEMLEMLRPLVKTMILIPPPISRALDPKSYAGPEDLVCSGAAEALDLALRPAGGRGSVLVTGSLFTVSAIRAIVLGESTDPPIGL